MTVIRRWDIKVYGVDPETRAGLGEMRFSISDHGNSATVYVDLPPDPRLQGAVSDRDALLTYIHRSDHLKPAEGCPDCAAVLDALDLYRGGQ